ncbi:nuclear transport factor 2 family protein [Streptomyces sp. NPDC096040]|uniref:nuclear transport factor 2 family protein n=1 Tax=Streptomyces sp. NPDC096040 TaxID=3155541 RepID=UPI0033329FAD
MPVSEPPLPRTPREVLALYRQAMRDKSADDLAELYAVDGVHEFPFTSPGFPARYEGREEIRAGYRAAWGAGPVRVTEIKESAVHETTDPQVIVAEQTVIVGPPAGGEHFDIPGVLVLRVRGGRLVRVRDYMDGYGVARAGRGSGY